jgi:hypothetical protein
LGRLLVEGSISSPANANADALVSGIVRDALQRTPQARAFQASLLQSCAVRLEDVVDHVATPVDSGAVEAAGWRQIESRVWRHTSGGFPDIVESNQVCVAFRVEDLDHFLASARIESPVEGPACGPYRRARVFSGRGAAFDAVERNGWVGYDTPVMSERRIRRARIHQQIFRTRRRHFRSTDRGFAHTMRLVEAAGADLGPHWTCSLFVRAEREYWSSRCDAGRLQMRRQRAAGVGWCNPDHEVYNCSREHTHHLVRILAKLGYEAGAVLKAGSRAGWVSQTLRQPALRSTIFVDVQLKAQEIGLDLSVCRLSPLTSLDRPSLWCAAHGESMLEGGLSRVAGLFGAAALHALLACDGVELLPALCNSPNLKRQRTRGEWRAVEPRRADCLQRAGYLTRSEAERMRLSGEVATQMEIIERGNGFRGYEDPIASAEGSIQRGT